MAKKILRKNVVGEELQKYVSNQIKRRQITHGSGVLSSRTPEELVVLNSNNSWIKLASGVAITEEKLNDLGISGENLEKFQGMGLAKNHILFGGISNLTDKGKNYKLNQQDSFIGTYEFEQDFGIVPMPGIQDLTIKALNRGSLKKALIKIKAQNRNQLNILDALYLRLGYTVLLEWGNSVFLDNEQGRIQKVQDTILENKELFFNESWQNKAYNDILERIEEYRIQYEGNYDGMLGKVSNFDWKFNEDGSYDITLTVLSYGDVIESLKTNITARVDTLNYLSESTISRDIGKSVNDNRESNIIFSLLQTFKIVEGLENGKYRTGELTINKNARPKIGNFIGVGPAQIITATTEYRFKTTLNLITTKERKTIINTDTKWYKINPYKKSNLRDLYYDLAYKDIDAFKTVPWATTKQLGSNSIIVSKLPNIFQNSDANRNFEIPYPDISNRLLRWILNKKTETTTSNNAEKNYIAFSFKIKPNVIAGFGQPLKDQLPVIIIPGLDENKGTSYDNEVWKPQPINTDGASDVGAARKIRANNFSVVGTSEYWKYKDYRGVDGFIDENEFGNWQRGAGRVDTFQFNDPSRDNFNYNLIAERYGTTVDKVGVRTLTKLPLNTTVTTAGVTTDYFPIDGIIINGVKRTDVIVEKEAFVVTVSKSVTITNVKGLDWKAPTPGYIGIKDYENISDPNYNTTTIGKTFYPADWPNLDRNNIKFYTLASLLTAKKKRTYIGIDTALDSDSTSTFENAARNEFGRGKDKAQIDFPQDYTKQRELGTFNILNDNKYYYYPAGNSTLVSGPTDSRLATTNTNLSIKSIGNSQDSNNQLSASEYSSDKVTIETGYQHPYYIWGLKGFTVKSDPNNVDDIVNDENVIFDGLETGYGTNNRGNRVSFPIIELNDFIDSKGNGPKFPSSTTQTQDFKDELEDEFNKYDKRDISEILKEYSQPQYGENGEIKKDGYEFFHRFVATEREKAVNEKKPFYWDIKNEINKIVTSNGPAENPLKFIKPFDDKGVVVLDLDPRRYYIRLGFLLQLVRDKSLLKINVGATEYEDNPPIFDIAYQQGISDMLCLPNQMSFDLSTCFVRNDNVLYFETDGSTKNYSLFSEARPWDHKNITDKSGYFSDVQTTLEFYESSSQYKSRVGKGEDRNVADIMNIYVEFDFVGDCMLSATDERGNMSTYDFVSNMCIGLNKALGGVNNLEPVIDETRNTLYIVDSSPKYDSKKLNPFNDQDSDYTLQVFGYNSTKENNINAVESTFSRKIDLQTAITPEYAAMIAIGATAAGYAKGIEATSFAKWNKGLKDRFKENFIPAEEPKSSSSNSLTSNISQFKEEVIQTYQQMMTLDRNKNNYNSLSLVPNGIRLELDGAKIGGNVSIATEYYKFLFGNRAAVNPDKFVGGGTGFIPFKLNITLDGISGFKIYQKLTVNTDFLPAGYAVTTEFIITGVDHILKDNDWETNLKLVMIPKFEDYEEIVTLDTFRSQPISYNSSTFQSERDNPSDDNSTFAQRVIQSAEEYFNDKSETNNLCAGGTAKIAQSINNVLQNKFNSPTWSGLGHAYSPDFKNNINNLTTYEIFQQNLIVDSNEIQNFINSQTWEYGDIIQYYLLPNPNSSNPTEKAEYNKYLNNPSIYLNQGIGYGVSRGSAVYHAQIYTGTFSKNSFVFKDGNIQTYKGSGWSCDSKANYGVNYVYGRVNYLPGDKYAINILKVKNNFK